MQVRRIAAAIGATTVSLSAAAVFVAGPAWADDPSSSPDPANDPNCTLSVPGDTNPTDEPTVDTTDEPTSDPTVEPTDEATTDPTGDPTVDPTGEPTDTPSDGATSAPVYVCVAEETLGSGTAEVPATATLPHTGAPVGSYALIGLTLVAGGSAIVVATRTSRSRACQPTTPRLTE